MLYSVNQPALDATTDKRIVRRVTDNQKSAPQIAAEDDKVGREI